MRKIYVIVFLVLLFSTFVLVACDDDSEQGEGTLTVAVWGEEFIEQGIPAAEFADEFSVTFSKFLVVISNISVAEEGSTPAIAEPAAKVWDLTQAGPFPAISQVVDSGTYDHTAFTIAPSAAAISGNATTQDVQLMNTGVYSVYVEGSATNGATTKTFAWGFQTSTIYDPCHSLGVLPDGGAVEVQITVHGDHFFYDDAVSATPELRFNDIALADTDNSGDVTQAELLAYDITVLSNYNVGSLAIYNMWDYIAYMTATLGHIDGEGHCNTQ